VLLTRDDVLAQAVSWQRAATTGSWRSDLPARGEAVFDEAAIGEKVRELRLQEEGWEALFGQLGIRPLRLTYERLRADPLGTVRAIAAHLGVILSEPLAEPVLAYGRQHDPEKDAWIRRLDPTRASSDPGI
jgi:LPS sulfotransferase NodH